MPKKFDANESSTFKPSNDPFIITYLGGSLSGTKALETVSVIENSILQQILIIFIEFFFFFLFISDV